MPYEPLKQARDEVQDFRERAALDFPLLWPESRGLIPPASHETRSPLSLPARLTRHNVPEVPCRTMMARSSLMMFGSCCGSFHPPCLIVSSAAPDCFTDGANVHAVPPGCESRGPSDGGESGLAGSWTVFSCVSLPPVREPGVCVRIACTSPQLAQRASSTDLIILVSPPRSMAAAEYI